MSSLTVESPTTNRSFSDFLLGAAISVAGPAIALLYFLSRNLDELSTTTYVWQALRYSAALGLFIVFVGSMKHRPRLFGVTAGVGGFVFWSMSWLDAPVAASSMVWLAITAAGSAILWWTAKDKIWHLGVVALSAFAVCFLSYNIWSSSAEVEANDNQLAFTELEKSPNIYMFVTDGFGRFDAMQEQFGVDKWPNEDIPQGWKDHGFTMDRSATANYAETTLSIPSMLNGSLEVLPGDNVNASRAAGLKSLSGKNQMTEWLKSHNYEYWHAGSGLFDASQCNKDLADRCYLAATGNEAQSALFDISPFASAFGSSSEISASERVSAADIGEWAVSGHSAGSQPRFVFAHLIEPHPPYSQACLESHGVAGKGVGSLSEGWSENHKPMYVAQSSCLMDDLGEAIDTIVSVDPEALVLIQSDHGPAFDISWMKLGGWTIDDVRQRFAVFRATKLPESCAISEPQESSLVNTFPIIKGCLEGQPPELVEADSFLTRYGETSVELITNTEDGALQPST